MSIDQVLTGLIYLVSVFVLFIIGKFVFDKSHPRFNLQKELLEHDNFALALAVIGYYFGLIMVIGGVLIGPSSGWVEDLIDIFFYGLISIVLLNISALISDKLILYKFDDTKEIIDDRNAGTGAVVAGNYIAVGLIIGGAISGEGGGLITAVVFWLLGQGALILAGLVYNWITPFDVHAEVEKDNVAVGVAFAGGLIGIGNVIRIAVSGDFISWQTNISDFCVYVVIGLVLLPIARLLTDKVLLPGAKLTDELVNQEKPNVGAAAIEAFSYIAASMLIGWAI